MYVFCCKFGHTDKSKMQTRIEQEVQIDFDKERGRVGLWATREILLIEIWQHLSLSLSLSLLSLHFRLLHWLKLAQIYVASYRVINVIWFASRQYQSQWWCQRWWWWWWCWWCCQLWLSYFSLMWLMMSWQWSAEYLPVPWLTCGTSLELNFLIEWKLPETQLKIWLEKAKNGLAKNPESENNIIKGQTERCIGLAADKADGWKAVELREGKSLNGLKNKRKPGLKGSCKFFNHPENGPNVVGNEHTWGEEEGSRLISLWHATTPARHDGGNTSFSATC